MWEAGSSHSRFPLPTLYTSQPDFDHLPIPFRAVATDIETGEMVIISRGTVMQAMRASVAIPGVFSPASLDGRLLVDGGIVRNLPVDVVRDMGADIVIAVNVSMPVKPEEPDPFGSVSGILAQSVTLATQDNIAEQKALADLVIEPDLRKIGRLRFDRAGEIVQRGRDATSALATDLRRYANTSGSNRAAHAALPASVTIDSVEIVNHSKIATQVIRRSLHIRLGEELDWKALRADLSRVHEFGLTERVDLEFVNDGALTILRLEAQKKTQPTVVQFGFTFSDDVEQNTRFDLHARVTSRELNRLGAESRNDLALGTNRLVRSEWYQPLEYSRTLFVVPSARYEKSPDDFYRGNRRIAQYETEIQSARLEAGLQIGRFGEVRTGFELGHVKSTIATGSDSLPQWDTARSMLTAGATIDMLDDASFPTSGGIGTWTWRGARKIAGGDLVYERTEAILALFRSSGRTTVFWTGRAGTDLDSNAPLFEQFSLGGLRSMSGYHEDQLRGPVLTTARLGAFRSIYSISQVFRSQVYVGAWLDAGNVWATADKARLDELRYSGSVFVGIDAPVGPVYLTYGRTDDGRDAAYLTIGLKLTDGES